MSVRTSFALVTVYCMTLSSTVLGQGYPSRPINVIVPFAAGGNVDVLARWIAPGLGQRLGQQVIINNIAGAGGAIGTERAARASADGYTLLVSTESTIVIAKLISPAVVRYDGLRDLAPVTALASSALVLVGKPELPAADLRQLLSLLRTQKLNYATPGVGTSAHVAGEIFNYVAKVQMSHVPYKSGAQILTDVIGNQVDLAMVPVPLTNVHINAGKMKGYGVTSAERSAAVPDVPAMAELPELKRMDMTLWFGLFAPAGTDRGIVQRTHRDTAEVLNQPEMRKKFSDSGMKTLSLGPEQFAAFLDGEGRKYGELVRAANVRAE